MNGETDFSKEAPPAPVEVPVEALSSEALAGIIDNFILREGTDYGAVEVDHEAKIRRLRKQLECGDVVLSFDPATESVSLLTHAEWTKLSRSR